MQMYEDYVGLPKSPAKWLGQPEYIPATKLTVTWGGGMGGSSWDILVERIDINSIPSNGFIEIKGLDNIAGQTYTINTRYIVRMSNDYVVVHRKYHNNNTNFEIGDYDWWGMTTNNNKLTFAN